MCLHMCAIDIQIARDCSIYRVNKWKKKRSEGRGKWGEGWRLEKSPRERKKVGGGGVRSVVKPEIGKTALSLMLQPVFLQLLLFWRRCIA